MPASSMPQLNLRAADEAVLKKYLKIPKSPNRKNPFEFNMHDQCKGRSNDA
jgi:hypothetical protein